MQILKLHPVLSTIQIYYHSINVSHLNKIEIIYFDRLEFNEYEITNAINSLWNSSSVYDGISTKLSN